ncbi:MFS transporter [Nocardia sp. 2]|uniref:MFS transporter n=1 Tax=Nocardia acididurans TaxID=2802282 RepID=A0ABS1M449_9NOCA|nr:Cmx/CmrA family chloramphenicol efflux MFS transporter [Nocardia acididurans]MBL1075433.1 MFS transporter [Nocardia acididurans]
MRQPIPLSVYALAAAIFAQGTSELMLSGLLPDIAADLNVSVSDAGLLASGFAVGMAVGAPLLTVATLRWPRRRAMLIFLAAFAVTHIAGALAPTYGTLMATRVLGAVVYAGFWVVSAVTVIGLVPPDAKGRALSIVAGGLTIATVLGVPAGTAIGNEFGWRTTVWVVVALTVLSAAAILATIPAQRRSQAAPPSLRKELAVIANPRLWLAYVATAMSSGQGVATFTYLGALLVVVAGIPAGWIPVALVISGIGSLAGLIVGGRVADRHPFTTLAVGYTGAAVASLLLLLVAAEPIPVILLAAAQQFFAFLTNPAVNVRVFTLAAASPNLAGAGNITAFNIGIIIGPALAGLLITAHGLASIGWASAALALTGLLATAAAYPLRHKDSEPAPEPPPLAAAVA